MTTTTRVLPPLVAPVVNPQKTLSRLGVVCVCHVPCWTACTRTNVSA